MNKSTELAIKSTIMYNGTLGRPMSKSWYLENADNLLHPTIRCFDDALEESKSGRVWIVYFRVIKKLDENSKEYFELETLGRAKVGKGYFEDGDETRDPSAGGSDGILETWAAIACVNEAAAEALEELLHKELKNQGRWIPRIANNQNKKSGEEWFDQWDKIRLNAVAEFNSLIEKVTTGSNVGRRKFKPRYYQESGAKLLADFLMAGGDMKDFFLLFKPRAGKNATILLGFAYFIKSLRDQGVTDCIISDFISQWPSAFAGLIKDIKQYIYVDGVTIGYVDTSKSDWLETQQELKKTCDLIIRLISMQSINQSYAQECDDDEEYEGPNDSYDKNKVVLLKLDSAKFVIIDESDHGMRTKKSQDFLTEFGYTKTVWMSGTDLYALKHKIKPGNHAVYDIIQERIDIENGVFDPEVRSKMRMHKTNLSNLPYPNLTGSVLDEKKLSRRQRNLCETTQSSDKPPRKPGKDKLFRDAEGKIIDFVNKAEVIAAFNQYYNWFNFSGTPSPADHDHIFWTMPSLTSCKALYNLITQGQISCQHYPLFANNYGSAFTIEEEVNNDMKRHRRTMFITVGRMLRGAKAPWSAVVRWDDYSDYKVGLQLMLRGQNTDQEWFDVYDCNPFRTSIMRFEIVKNRSNGKKVDSEGRKLYKFVPIYRLTSGESIEETWEETIADYQTCSVKEGYRRQSILDEKGVASAKDILLTVDPSKKNKSLDKDPDAGKLGSPVPKKPGSRVKGQTDPLEDLKNRALTIATMLPLLVALTQGKVSEVDELITDLEEDIFTDWLIHCGVDVSGLQLTLARKLIINLFDAEEVNNQLSITCQRFKENGIESFDWANFNQSKKGSVTTPASAVNKLLLRLPEVFWTSGPTCLDPSCNFGEWVVEIANRLQAHGFDPTDYIHYADTSAINVRITSLRLGFNNGFCYNIKDGKEKEIINDLKGQFMNKLGLQKFDLYATNPPFQKADKSGNDADNLWPSFLELGHQLTKPDGYMVMITPGSWASLGTNATEPGSKIRKKYFDTKQTELVDFTIGEHFDVGSTFTGYVIKNTKNDPTLDAALVFKDNIIVGKFADYPCFSLFYSNSEFIDIVKKFRTSQHYDIIMNDPYHTPRAAMPKKIKDGDYSTVQGPDHPYRVYHTNAQDTYYSKYKNDFHDQWKAVFSYSGSWKAEVTNACSLTDASMCILTDTKEEAESVQSVLQSAPIKFLIDKVFRWGGYYNGLFISWIPALPMTKIYTDEDVYKLLFNSAQTKLIQGLLLAELSKKTAKKQEREEKKAAKELDRANKPNRVKKVKS